MVEAKRRAYAGVAADTRRAGRRERLIRAAIAVYGRLGYRGASIQAVCAEAGLGPRYFYESFAGSEVLLAAAFEAVVDAIIRDLRIVADATAGEALTKVRAVLDAYYTRLRAEPATARVFLLELADVSPAIDRQFDAAMMRFARLNLGMLGRDPDTVAPLGIAGMMGGLLAIARSWIASGCEAEVAAVVEAAMPQFLAFGLDSG